MIFLIEPKNQNRRRGSAAYAPTGKRIFFPEYKKRRLPTDRRTLILTASAIYRKRIIYVIFCRMERPCNPQLNYRVSIKIYPVFPGPNFRLSLHPLCSPSAKENLWTFYRQPPSVWGEHTWKYSILFPKVSIFFQSTLKLCSILQKKRGLILPRFFTPRIYNRRHRHFLYNRVYRGQSLIFSANYSHGC